MGRKKHWLKKVPSFNNRFLINCKEFCGKSEFAFGISFFVMLGTMEFHASRCLFGALCKKLE